MGKKCVYLMVPAMYSGGQERVVSRLTSILKDTYDLKVLLFDQTMMDYPLDCEFYSLDLPSRQGNPIASKLIMVVRRIRKVRKLIKKDRPFASVSFGHGANIVNVAACAGLCPSIVSLRGYESLLCLKKRKGFPDRLLTRKAGKIICVSRAMADDLANMMPDRKHRIHVLYNAYDTEEIKTMAERSTEMDEWFAGNSVIITVGTLAPVKGYWHLIKAFSLLKKKHPDLKLVHIGPDYAGYGMTLKKLSSDLGLEEEVRFLGYRDNPYQYMARSRMFLLSSISEGFPNALVEAMACQIPVIAADCMTGPREILSNDYRRKATDRIEMADYGILVPPMNGRENYDPDQIEACDQWLAEAAGMLLEDRTMARKYGEKARKRADDFSYAMLKKEIIDIIEQ
jgi:glycosyltransferase involved in cell wall biosynthesis